jgi:ubiquitin carboxyl-terminal hydrolase 4/11/15
MYGDSEKINNKITFPINGLDITKYIHPLSENKNNTYDLFAINNHTNFNKFGFNGISFGHYYSYCKNEMDSKWYDYNDESVNEIDEKDIVTENAYILFYKLRD